MKKSSSIIMLGLIATTFTTAHAAEKASCPSHSAKTYVCKAASQVVNGKKVEQSFDTVTVCQKKGREALLIVEKTGEKQDVNTTSEETGTKISYTSDVTDGVRLAFTVTKAAAKNKEMPASMILNISGSSMQKMSDYNCTRGY